MLAVTSLDVLLVSPLAPLASWLACWWLARPLEMQRVTLLACNWGQLLATLSALTMAVQWASPPSVQQ